MQKPCECCWITTVDRSVTNSSPYCAACNAHLFNLKNLRADHEKVIADGIKNHERRVAKAQESQEWRSQTADDLRRERNELVQAAAQDFANGLSDGLTKLISNSVDVELRERLQNAYSARNRAMAAVGQVFDIHDETLSGKCKCGKPLSACRDYKALAFFRDAFGKWESQQISLLKAGKHHGLPADHPESRKVYRDRWSWKGAPAIRIDERSRRMA